MKVEQIKGPFSANATKTFGATDNRTYKHLGIQIPKRQPIAYNSYRALSEGKASSPVPKHSETLSGLLDVDIETTNSAYSYKINEKNCLEFDGNLGNEVKITFLRDMPPETIIDLIYEPE
jgi:hypothetical protein